jgi:hypothetical protein
MRHASRLTEFYSGGGPDNKGRFLHQILDWDNGRMEAVHDYIQWLFPLGEPSAFNYNAPLLTPEDISEFNSSSELKENLIRSFDRMIGFYGFVRNGMHVERAVDYKERIHNWVNYGNHNFLRITRILKCLGLLGLNDYAQAFMAALSEVYIEHRDIIGDSYEYWKRAVK